MKHLEADNRYPEIVILPCQMLHKLVEPVEAVLIPLRKSIRLEGLREPLVVVDMSVQEWYQDKQYMNPDILEPPSNLYPDDKVYRVQRGNNRLVVAISLGYDKIDCVVFDSIEEAGKFGEEQRKRNKGWQAIS